MPYADAYTYVPLSGYGAPYVFAYYPIFGWTWLAAPWVWGFGPWPFFGVVGPARFAWFVHGWWRFPARWHYLPTTRVFYGMRSAPFNRFGTLPGRVGRGPYMSGTGFRGGAPFMGGGRGNRFAPRAGMMGRGFSGR